MGLREIYNETITLIPKQLRMMQERNMISFFINDWKFEQSPEKGVRMVIVFRRKITGENDTFP